MIAGRLLVRHAGRVPVGPVLHRWHSAARRQPFWGGPANAIASPVSLPGSSYRGAKRSEHLNRNAPHQRHRSTTAAPATITPERTILSSFIGR
jgi:hypothetical protein